MSLANRLPPEEIAEHLSDLGDVPVDILPDGPARLALVWLISAGLDVYTYASGGPTYGTWVAWLQPLADVRPEKDGRVPISEWCASWRSLLAEMGLSDLPEPAAAEREATA